MKFSVQSYTMSLGDWGKDCNIETLCKWTKSIGVDAIDWFGTYGSDIKEVKTIMDDYGLLTSCYTFFADLNFPDKKNALNGMDDFKRSIDEACELDCNIVMMPISGKPEFDRDTQRKQITDNLNEVIDFAKKANVIVTVENFDNINAPFITSDDMIKGYNMCPDLFVTYDSGNMLIANEDSCESFEKSKHLVKFMHFKDFKSCASSDRLCFDGSYIEPALIGNGLIDYPKLVKMVNEAYDGYINIEYQANDLTPEEAVVRAIEYLKSLE